MLAQITRLELELHWTGENYDKILVLFRCLQHLRIVIPDGNLRVDQPSVLGAPSKLQTITLIFGPEVNGVQSWLRASALDILVFIDRVCRLPLSKLDELLLSNILLGTSPTSRAAELVTLNLRFEKVSFQNVGSQMFEFC